MLIQTTSGETPGGTGEAPAIALAHLKRLTMNDQDLEHEVLTLFRRLSVDHLKRIRSASTVDDRREAAHSLAGAARGAGAFAVADIARDIEVAGVADEERLESLDRAVQAAVDFIAKRLSD